MVKVRVIEKKSKSFFFHNTLNHMLYIDIKRKLCYIGRHNVAYSRESDDVMIAETNAGNGEGGLAYKRGVGHSAM